MILKPVQLQTTDREMASLVRQIELMRIELNKYSSNNDSLIGSLQDESLSSDVLIAEDTVSGFIFLVDDDGTLMEDA